MPTINCEDSNDDSVNESQVQTLAKAAKISHIINETTIGSRLASSKVESHEEREEPKMLGRRDPWKRDEWVSVQNEKSRSISFSDFKSIKFKMELRNAEKIRQKQVRLEMVQRQEKFIELEQMMNGLKISLSEKSAKKLRKNLLLKEEQILQITQQIENNSRLAEEQVKREMDEYSKKTAERLNSLKRAEQIRGYFQSIKSLKELFIRLFEKYVKTCISNQQHLKNFVQYTDAREKFLNEYESLLKTVNSGQLTSTEVDKFEALCDEIKESQRSLDVEIKDAEDVLQRKLEERKEKQKLEEEKQLLLEKQQREQLLLEKQQREQQQFQQNQQLQQQPGPDDATDSPNVVNKDGPSQYEMIMKFVEDYLESVKPLKSDDATKKFRFDCKKGVNTLSNLICSKSQSHMQDNYDRLVLILSGNSVKIAGTQVVSSAHPLGIRFVNLLVAEMFVKQADTAIDVNPRAAFPIASLIVAIWQKFPDFGKLFLGYLYKQSPFLAPYYVKRLDGQSVQDYKKSIGFVYSNNVCEDETKFLKRLTGLVRLYASVIISKTRLGSNKPHPHGTEFGWRWLTSVLNLDPPIANVSATMVHEFLVIVGAELSRTYKKQFFKLISIIKNEYAAKLNEVGTGGPESRLEDLLQKIINERKIDPPEDMLPPNFW